MSYLVPYAAWVLGIPNWITLHQFIFRGLCSCNNFKWSDWLLKFLTNQITIKLLQWCWPWKMNWSEQQTSCKEPTLVLFWDGSCHLPYFSNRISPTFHIKSIIFCVPFIEVVDVIVIIMIAVIMMNIASKGDYCSNWILPKTAVVLNHKLFF